MRVSQAAELAVDGISKNYGGLRAVDEITFTVRGGEILGVAGPNGAGKTTLFDVITGLTRETSGDVRLDDVSVVGASVHHRCHLGLLRTFQQPTVAATLTVRENVVVGSRFGRVRSHWQDVPGVEEHVDAVLELTGLNSRAGSLAGPLGVFDKKRVMLASAVAAGPRVLLLDEPFGGLNPQEISATIELITRIREFGVAVICIEHVMRALVQLADRVLVMHQGRTLFEGLPQEMMADEHVIQVYLGAAAGGNGHD